MYDKELVLDILKKLDIAIDVIAQRINPTKSHSLPLYAPQNLD